MFVAGAQSLPPHPPLLSGGVLPQGGACAPSGLPERKKREREGLYSVLVHTNTGQHSLKRFQVQEKNELWTA